MPGRPVRDDPPHTRLDLDHQITAHHGWYLAVVASPPVIGFNAGGDDGGVRGVHRVVRGERVPGRRAPKTIREPLRRAELRQVGRVLPHLQGLAVPSANWSEEPPPI
ncbi:hypothetical protein [Actinomadura pelletieri]|uniref:hypothetical protein n=1 Tax=Actinomadura pelletieri TaxID=111805 RepID=UPI0011C47E35|nr:hypothetical protein [Actinomadura pelletieri]